MLLRTSLLLALGMLCFAAPSTAGPGGPKPKFEAADGEGFGPVAKSGLRSKISLAQKQYKVGAPIVVQYEIRNFGKQPATVWHSGFWPNHLIVVKDAAGKEPPLTAFGKQTRNAFSPNGPRDKNYPVKLTPGQGDKTLGKYDLRMLFDLSTPGKYTVEYVYDEGDPVNSNVVKFEVVAK